MKDKTAGKNKSPSKSKLNSRVFLNFIILQYMYPARNKINIIKAKVKTLADAKLQKDFRGETTAVV
jgi:hypothetical protein